MNLLHRCTTLSLPLLLLCPVHAAVDPAIVSADAQWVVALDLNDLRQSTLGKELLDLAQKQMQAGLAGSPVQLNIQKLLETVGSATAYGTNFSTNAKLVDGTSIIQGTADLRKIAEALILQATMTVPGRFTEVKGLPFTAYSIGGEVFVAFPPEPVIIVSKSQAQLIKARDTFRGAAPSLANSPALPLAALVAKSGPGFFVAASVVPPGKMFAPEAQQTRILQLLDSGLIAIGEEDQKTTAHLQLIASSDESADKLLKIVQGMVAMASLAETTDKQLAEFLQSASVDKQDRTINVQMAYSSDRIVQMIKTVQQQANPVAASTLVPAPSAPVAPGNVVAEWQINQATPGSVAGSTTLKDHAIDHVALVNGSTITLIGRRDLNGHAAIDCVDILPEGGTGTPLHFEAETMRLRGYAVRNAPYASHGKLVLLPGSYGTAQFDFPGEDGKYLIRVRYIDEPGGKSTLTVNVKDPDPAPAAPAETIPLAMPAPAAAK